MEHTYISIEKIIQLLDLVSQEESLRPLPPTMAGFLLHRRRSIYQEFYQVTSEFAPIRVLPISSLDPEKEHSGALTYVPLRVAHAYVPGIQNAARVGGGGGG